MLAKVYSCAVVGLEGVPVEVEVDISQGLPSFLIVGLPDTAVQESKERVRAAVKNSGYTFPMKRLTVNLAPADLRKAGPAYDLPIAIGLLLASEQVCGDVQRALFVGELSLDGALRHTDGVLPMVSIATKHGIETVYVPYDDAPEAGLVDGATVIPVRTMKLARPTAALDSSPASPGHQRACRSRSKSTQRHRLLSTTPPIARSTASATPATFSAVAIRRKSSGGRNTSAEASRPSPWISASSCDSGRSPQET